MNAGCNRKEPEEAVRLRDGRGEVYLGRFYQSVGGWTMKVFASDTLVAVAHCLLRDEEVVLSDLFVYETATHAISKLAHLKCLFGLSAHGRVENYRHRGIGTALLQYLIQRARQDGFKRVSGKLAKQDLETNPQLANWYRKRGFEATVSKSELTGDILMELRE
jgi:GNAT superfamily N-acetyltransferase